MFVSLEGSPYRTSTPSAPDLAFLHRSEEDGAYVVLSPNDVRGTRDSRMQVLPSPELARALAPPPPPFEAGKVATAAASESGPPRDFFTKVYVGSITIVGLYAFYRIMVKYR
jgi:hypothetical protein